MRPPSVTTTSPTALSLLANRAFHIEFQGYLSNHAKHAVVALDKLDAAPQRVQEYWDQYTAVTPYQISLCPVETPWKDVAPCTLAQWNQWRGQKTHWQEQVAFMESELARLDGDTTQLVQQYAPSLLGGIAGSLTHGIIHLGWAIDANSPYMIAEGLAYLNFCYLGVDESKLRTNQHDDTTPMDSVVRAAESFHTQQLASTWVDATKAAYDESFHPELVVAGFQWHLAKILDRPNAVATDLPSWIQNDKAEDVWEALYRCVVYLYLNSRDDNGNGSFVVLHLITSLWGLEQVCRTVNDMQVTRAAWSQFYAVMISVLATAGAVPSKDALQSIQKDYPASLVDDPDWTPIVQKGIAEVEEHNIKLVYVSRELWRRYRHWKGFSEAARSFTLTPNIGPANTAFE